MRPIWDIGRKTGKNGGPFEKIFDLLSRKMPRMPESERPKRPVSAFLVKKTWKALCNLRKNAGFAAVFRRKKALCPKMGTRRSL